MVNRQIPCPVLSEREAAFIGTVDALYDPRSSGPVAVRVVSPLRQEVTELVQRRVAAHQLRRLLMQGGYRPRPVLRDGRRRSLSLWGSGAGAMPSLVPSEGAVHNLSRLAAIMKRQSLGSPQDDPPTLSDFRPSAALRADLGGDHLFYLRLHQNLSRTALEEPEARQASQALSRTSALVALATFTNPRQAPLDLRPLLAVPVVAIVELCLEELEECWTQSFLKLLPLWEDPDAFTARATEVGALVLNFVGTCDAVGRGDLAAGLGRSLFRALQSLSGEEFEVQHLRALRGRGSALRDPRGDAWRRVLSVGRRVLEIDRQLREERRGEPRHEEALLVGQILGPLRGEFADILDQLEVRR